MKLYDISQEVFSCCVYPGDPAPVKEQLCSMEQGDMYNLTAFSMCAHNGTHLDAPKHFIADGKAVDEIPLSHTVGPAYVAEAKGLVEAREALEILEKAKQESPNAAKRILLKGDLTLTPEGADVFAQAGVWLVGNEAQTVGPADAPMEVHLKLLGAGVVLLEGVRLSDVPQGVYLLNAAPISLGGGDGAPCRAWLMELGTKEEAIYRA